MTDVIGERATVARSLYWQNRGYRSLAAAIIKQAAIDAREPGFTGADARRWLLDVGYTWLQILDLGIDWDLWESWINSGCLGSANHD